MNRRRFLASLPVALLAGCGFELRRLEGIPFASLYIDAPQGGAVTQRIRNTLAASKQTRLAATADAADAVLHIGPEARSKTILSLSGAGRVTEYRLGLQLTYRITGKDGRTLASAEVIELSREITYDDAQVLAKAAEEQLLYRDMDENAARRIMRRLQSLKSEDGMS